MYHLGVNGKPIRRTRGAKPFNFGRGPARRVPNPQTSTPEPDWMPKLRRACDHIVANKMTSRVVKWRFFKDYLARKGKFEEELRKRGVDRTIDVVIQNAKNACRPSRDNFRTTEEAFAVLLAFPEEKAQETQTPSKPEYVLRWNTQKVLMLDGEEKELFRPSHYERV